MTSAQEVKLVGPVIRGVDDDIIAAVLAAARLIATTRTTRPCGRRTPLRIPPNGPPCTGWRLTI